MTIHILKKSNSKDFINYIGSIKCPHVELESNKDGFSFKITDCDDNTIAMFYHLGEHNNKFYIKPD